MTVKLQELAIKSELKVAMRYKNFKTVAMRCKNKCYKVTQSFVTRTLYDKFFILAFNSSHIPGLEYNTDFL